MANLLERIFSVPYVGIRLLFWFKVLFGFYVIDCCLQLFFLVPQIFSEVSVGACLPTGVFFAI